MANEQTVKRFYTDEEMQAKIQSRESNAIKNNEQPVKRFYTDEEMQERQKSKGIDNYITEKEPQQKRQSEGFISDIRTAIPEAIQMIRQLPVQAYSAAKQFTPALTPQENAELTKQARIGALRAAIMPFVGAGQAIINVAPPMMNPQNILNLREQQKPNLKQELGLGEKEGDVFLEGAGLAAVPSIAAEEELGLLISTAGKALEAGFLTGASGGNPFAGALAAAPISVGSKYIGKNFNKEAREQILDAAEQGGLIDKTQAAKSLKENYMLESGEKIPVDIATLTGSKQLGKMYKGASAVSGKGFGEFEARRDRGILAKEAEISQADYNKNINDIQTDYVKNVSDVKSSYIDAINKLDKPIDRDLTPYIESLGNAHSALSQKVNASPAIVDMMALRDNIPVDEASTSAIRALGKKEREAQESMRKKLDERNINLGEFAKPADFKQYNESIKKIANKSELMEDIFGTDSEMMSTLRGEKARGEFFAGNQDVPNVFGIILPDSVKMQMAKKGVFDKKSIPLDTMIDHVRFLQEQAEIAKTAGYRAEGKDLMNAAMSLKSDIKDVLRKNGKEDAANELELADQHFINNILPLRRDSTISGIISDKTYKPEPKSVIGSLLKKDNEQVFQALPSDVKTAILRERISKMKGDVEGMAVSSPEELINNYTKNLSTYEKKLLQQSNPGISAYFENAPKDLRNLEILKDKHAEGVKQLSMDRKQSQDFYQKQRELEIKRQKEIDEARYKRDKRISDAEYKREKEKADMLKFKRSEAATLLEKAEMPKLSVSSVISGVFDALKGYSNLPMARAMGKQLLSEDTVNAYLSGDRYLGIKDINALRQALFGVSKKAERTPVYESEDIQ